MDFLFVGYNDFHSILKQMTKMNSKASVLWVFGVVAILLSSCGSRSFRIRETYDAAVSARRVELNLSHLGRSTNNFGLYTLNQNIIKEIKEGGETVITVYDLLKIDSEGFDIEKKVFIIVGENESHSMELLTFEKQFDRYVASTSEEIMRADSSNVSVVTQISETKQRTARFKYVLSADILSKIKNSNQISLQYYAGPDLISVQLKGRSLRKLKELIDRN